MANNEVKIKDLPVNTKDERELHAELLRRAKHVKLDENATAHLVEMAEETAAAKAEAKAELSHKK